MKSAIDSSNVSLSRRSFLGTATAAISSGAILAPGILAQSPAQPVSQQAGSTPSAKTAPAAPHITTLAHKQPYHTTASGTITRVDARDMPRMKRLSIRRLLLAPKGVREPHWHANAHELGYCLQGDHLVTIAGNHGTRSSFTISAGEMFFVPSGAMHHVENIGSGQGEIILGFSHEQPEDFALSGTFGCFSDAVLGNTFGLPASAFAGLQRSPQDRGIGKRSTAAQLELQQKENSPYKFAIERILPEISSPAGSAHLAKSNLWPALEDIAMFSIDITHQGMREMHWHPETAEMGYITQGRGRITVVSPGGSVDTFELHPGDVYFIPAAYPHHIENLDSGDLKVLVFFDRVTPGDVGMKTAIPSYSREVLAASFDVAPSAFPETPFAAEDTLIVPRVNPIDPLKP